MYENESITRGVWWWFVKQWFILGHDSFHCWFLNEVWLLIISTKNRMRSSDVGSERPDQTQPATCWYGISPACQELARLTICYLKMKHFLQFFSRPAEMKLHLSQPLAAAESDLFLGGFRSTLCDFKKYVSVPKLPVDFYLLLFTRTCPRIWLCLKANVQHKCTGVHLYTTW